MAFKMCCPKCGGLDYSVERDNRTFGAVAQTFEFVFHCRCGKQLFGDNLVKEYERQKKEWEDGADQRAEEAQEAAREAARPKPAPETAAPSPSADAGRVAPPTPSRKAPAAVAAPAAVDDEDDEDDEDEDEDDDGEQCAWPGCEKARRPNSKYCSRACSNKNARHRHKQRRKKTKKTKESAAA
jgi:hypothetical protein